MRGPSLNAKRVGERVVEKVRKGSKVVLGQIMEEEGYAKTTAQHPQKVTKQKSYMDVLNKAGVTDIAVSNIHKELLGMSNIQKFYIDSNIPRSEERKESETKALYHEARRIVIEENKANTSLLQKRLKIGYMKAAHLIDMLEVKGIIDEHHEIIGDSIDEDEEDESNEGDGSILIPRPQPVGVSDEEITKVIEAVPGCKVLFINRLRSRWGMIEVIYSAPDAMTRKAAVELAYKVKGQFAPDKLAILGQITHTHEYKITVDRRKELDAILKDNE